MKELLEIVLIFIVSIGTVIVALSGMRAAKISYKTKSIGSEMILYRKLFLKTILMYIVGITVFIANISNYTIELIITFIGVILSAYILFFIIREKKSASND